MTMVQSPVSADPVVPAGRRRRWWPALLVVLALLGAGWLVGWSPLLSVREVRVLGVDPGLAAQVRAAAAVPLGTPLARVSSSAVTERIDALPPVASVEVRRGWPNVLVLVVAARVAVAVVPDPPGFALLDAGATKYSQVRTRPAGLPLVTAPPGAARTAALAVLTALPTALRSQVGSVAATTAGDVVLSLRSGTQVRWGGVDQGGRKAQIVLALLVRRPAMVDVSAPTLPTTTGVLKP